jgi:hypothetical protein
VNASPSPAAAEEQAQLRALRERADAAGRDLNDTITALAARLSGPARRARTALTVTAVTVSGVLIIVTAVFWQHRHRR